MNNNNIFEKLIEKIKDKTAVIGVIGLGYVGLPLAREFLKADYKVIGFDIDEQKVSKINKGISYIKHINNDFIKNYVNCSKFFATSDFSKLIEVEIILICVPTPLGIHYEPDLQYIKNSCKEILRYLKQGHVIILESTTYPGTTEEEILPILHKNKDGLQIGIDYFLGYSPEREDPGNKEYVTYMIPKIVSGVTESCCNVIKTFYSQIVKKVYPVSSPKIAEAAKLLENIYRAVNIALVNELKVLFYKMNIDIWEVIEAAKTKPFGFQAFYPGPGLGGHCIPIDPFYLTWKAREYDFHTRFIELAGEINNSMPEYVINRTIQALNSNGKSINGAKVLILGIAYKPDVDDMRESPSLKLIDLFIRENAQVDFNDPFIEVIPPTRKYNFKLKSVDLTTQNLRRYDAVILSTNHSQYDYKLIYENSKLIIDTRNAFDIKGVRNEKLWKS